MSLKKFLLLTAVASLTEACALFDEEFCGGEAEKFPIGLVVVDSASGADIADRSTVVLRRLSAPFDSITAPAARFFVDANAFIRPGTGRFELRVTSTDYRPWSDTVAVRQGRCDYETVLVTARLVKSA